MLNPILLFDRKSLFPARCDHRRIAVHSVGEQSVFSKNIQPFPATAADIDNRHIRRTQAAFHKAGDVHFHPLFYLLFAPSEQVLEIVINHIGQ